MYVAVGAFLVVMGAGIAGIWTLDIARNPAIDLGDGLFRARDADGGGLLSLHWAAEYGTAVMLLAAGVGLLIQSSWASSLALLATGALLYTSTNSLGWVFAEAERRAYAVPMMVGLVGGLASAVWLIVV